MIPSALVKRVEVLTGGASSVYGADAVAGVVNFIIDTSFEGVRFDGNLSTYQHNQHDPSVSGGLNMSDILAAKKYPLADRQHERRRSGRRNDHDRLGI